MRRVVVVALLLLPTGCGDPINAEGSLSPGSNMLQASTIDLTGTVEATRDPKFKAGRATVEQSPCRAAERTGVGKGDVARVADPVTGEILGLGELGPGTIGGVGQRPGRRPCDFPFQINDVPDNLDMYWFKLRGAGTVQLPKDAIESPFTITVE